MRHMIMINLFSSVWRRWGLSPPSTLDNSCTQHPAIHNRFPLSLAITVPHWRQQHPAIHKRFPLSLAVTQRSPSVILGSCCSCIAVIKHIKHPALSHTQTVTAILGSYRAALAATVPSHTQTVFVILGNYRAALAATAPSLMHPFDTSNGRDPTIKSTGAHP